MFQQSIGHNLQLNGAMLGNNEHVQDYTSSSGQDDDDDEEEEDESVE